VEGARSKCFTDLEIKWLRTGEQIYLSIGWPPLRPSALSSPAARQRWWGFPHLQTLIESTVISLLNGAASAPVAGVRLRAVGVDDGLKR
jgi:hypothetical protein